MSSEFPETELIVSIAEDVKKLSSLLGPNYHLDFKTALSCVELYKSTFGDEGFSALENKVNFLSKYIYEKHEGEELQQIFKFQSKLELLKTFQVTNYYDKKAYQSFIKSEKEEIATFADKSSLEKINDPKPKQGQTPPLEMRNINSKEKTMPKIMSDVWIKDNEVNFYRETLRHTFNNSEEIGFVLLRRGISKIDDPLLIGADDGYDSFALQFSGNETAAKKMIEDSIIHFDKNQKVNLYILMNYFKINIEQKISLDSAAGFVDYFMNSNKSSLEKINDPKPKQGQTPPLERRNFNSKENFMSDEFEEQEEQNLDPKQLKMRNAAFQRNVVAKAIKDGTLCCLPGQDGYADTTPAVNIMSIDKPYHGANLLFLKDHQKHNDFPTAEYITSHMIDEAKKDKPDLFIRQGQKGVSLHVSEKSEETGDWEDKHIRLFNVAQLNKPAVIKEWAAQKREEKAQERLAYLQTQYGTGYKPPEPKPKETVPEIVCSSTEPEKYLGQYFAAVSMGNKFKASPEQAAEFSDKMVKSFHENWVLKSGEPVLGKIGDYAGQPVSNPYKLEEISRNANSVCKEFMRDLRMESQKQNQPEQKQEQQQSRGGRGM